LGFEAQRVLAAALPEGYDLYGYLEDDLLISAASAMPPDGLKFGW